jgi:type II secretory pathway component HofQ
LENGDTAVIGGAFRSVNDNQMNGVPGLMKLPLIGMLFSGKTFTETKNEVLIFLTAKILNSEESFKRTF